MQLHRIAAALLLGAAPCGCSMASKVRSQAAAELRCDERALEVVDATRPNLQDDSVYRVFGCGQAAHYECLRGVYWDPICHACSVEAGAGSRCVGYGDAGE